MASFEVSYSWASPTAVPTEEETPHVPPPVQTADGEEYLCGHSGNAHPYANAGRDQDRSRQDEMIAAQGCARYVS
jgi:hypothetical protein